MDRQTLRITNLMHKEFDPFLIKIVKSLETMNVTPNILSLLGLFFSIIGAILISRQIHIWAGFILIIAGLCDVFDGLLAKTSRQESKLGAFLDSTFDQISDSVIFLSLAYTFISMNDQLYSFLSIINLPGALITSYIKAKAKSLGIDCSIGPFGRFERFLTLIICLILNQIKILILISIVLSITTIILRFSITYKKLYHT